MKLYFVCEGNTCRSPMMEFAFRDYLELQYIEGVEVASRGIAGGHGALSPYASAVLFAHGIVHTEKPSRLFTDGDHEDADLIVALTDEIAKRLVEVYGRDKVIALSELADIDIPDPCGKGLEDYEKTYRVINATLPIILDFIRAKFDI